MVEDGPSEVPLAVPKRVSLLFRSCKNTSNQIPTVSETSEIQGPQQSSQTRTGAGHPGGNMAPTKKHPAASQKSE